MRPLITLLSESDTKAFARRLAGSLYGQQAIGLCGDLGAGKTTLVRYLVDALGGSSAEVCSPTFTLQQEYRLPSGMIVEHWDLYRLSTTPPELLEPPTVNVLRIVEWPDRVPGFDQSLTLLISISVRVDGAREVALSAPDERANQALLESGAIGDSFWGAL